MMVIEQVREKTVQIVDKHDLFQREITITCKELTPEESIGNPLHNDYPIQYGRERMIEADFLGHKGQAFSDSCSNFRGSVRDVLNLNLESNGRRAIFISSVNAILSHTGLIGDAVHCKNDDLIKCSDYFFEYLMKHNSVHRKILLVGLQPRMLERLSAVKNVRVCDLDADNIGKYKSGVVIDGPDKFHENAEWADAVYATGSTVVNGTIDDILETRPETCFFGVTISGAARLLGLNQFCYVMKI